MSTKTIVAQPPVMAPSLPRVVKTATDLARDGLAVRTAAQQSPVLITRRGDPVAVLDARPETLARPETSMMQAFSARDMNRSSGVADALELVSQGRPCRLTDTNRSVAVLTPADEVRKRIDALLSSEAERLVAERAVQADTAADGDDDDDVVMSVTEVSLADIEQVARLGLKNANLRRAAGVSTDAVRHRAT